MSSSPAAPQPRSRAPRAPGDGAAEGAADADAATASGEADAEIAARPDHGIVAGRYKILGRIAEGGMGVVYKAEHTLSRKKLAIKILHPHLCHGRQAVERFKREVSAAAEIDHHGIVQVFDAGVDTDGSFYMAMELLEGESLGNSTRRVWPGTRTAVKLIIEMCEPLARAHEKGFVHRDLKPDNVFIARDHAGQESVKLLDFGLVREVSRRGPTQSGITFGTPEYMAPEQAMSAKKAGIPADVWSVGVMLYELLAGQHPFTGETANAVMANAIKDPHPPLLELAPHVPAELARVVEQCLEKEPKRRPADAGALGAMLRGVAERVALDDRGPESPQLRARDEDDEDDGAPLVDGEGLDPRLSAPLPAGLRGHPTSDVRPARRRPGVVWPWALGALAASGLVAVVALTLSSRGGDADMVATELRGGAPPGASGGQGSGASAVADVDPPSAPIAAAVDPAPVPSAPADEPEGAVVAPATTDPAPDVEASSAREPRATTPRRRVTEAATTEGPSALESARECLARGDTRCAVAALQEGRSAAEMALLVDVYQMQGRASDARGVMQRYVQRFPRGAKTDEYRRTLGLAGQ